MTLTRRGCLGGMAGLGLLAASALEPLGPALRRLSLALGPFAPELRPRQAGPVLSRTAGEVRDAGVAFAITPPSTALLPAQLRAARRLLGWSEEETAKASGLSRAMLRGLEHATLAQQNDDRAAGGAGASEPDARSGEACAAQRLRETFEAAGVVFLGSAQEGPGVRLVAGQASSAAASCRSGIAPTRGSEPE